MGRTRSAKILTSTPAAAADVVIYASDIPAANIHGAWTLIADPSAAAGHALVTADAVWDSNAVPLVSPTHYVST